MFGRMLDDDIFKFLHGLALSTPEVKSSGHVARVRFAERVSERVGQRQGLPHPCRCTRRITQQLERPGTIHRARYSQILPGPKGGRTIGTVLLWVVELHPPLQMRERRGEFAPVE